MRQDLEKIIDSLDADPLYQLSTAGHELFHTNMLYWLARNRPWESRALWERLGVDPPVGGTADGDPGDILREWKHVDLVVDSGLAGRKLVLENKITAIADPDQLVRYHENVSQHPVYAHDTTAWRLLTLMPVRLSPPAPWQALTYEDLLPSLVHTASELSGRDAELVSGYVGLVRQLVALAAAADPSTDLTKPMTMSVPLREKLTAARALSLVRKTQMNRCAELLHQRLVSALPPDRLKLEAGLTNTQGLLHLFLRGTRGRHFGWQIQGDQLRFVVITSPRDKKKRADRELLVQGQHLDYFEVQPPTHLENLLAPFASRKEWLGYEPDFVYRYRKMSPDTTWEQMLQLLEWASRRAWDYVQAQD